MPCEVSLCCEMVRPALHAFFPTEIRIMVKQYQQPDREKVKAIEKKLDKCRNQANNPDSEL